MRVSGSMSLRDFLLCCYVPHEATRIESPRSLSEAQSQCRRFAVWLAKVRDAGEDGPATLGDLTRENVRAVRAAMIGAGLAVDTANKMVRYVSALWRLAADDWPEAVIEAPPARWRLRGGDVSRVTWRPGEWQLILDAAAAVGGAVGGVPAAAFWSGLLRFLGETGARITAAMLTKAGDFHEVRGAVRLGHAAQKQCADQVFSLSPELCELLAVVAPAGGGLLFGAWPLDGRWREMSRPTFNSLQRHYAADVLRPAGLPCSSDWKFHAIRRMVATWYFAEAGLDATRDLLGHSHVSVTRRYIDFSQIQGARDVASVVPRVAGRPRVRVVG